MTLSTTPLKLAKPVTTGNRRWDHLELLERIDATGSITAAAKAMGMSYKAAWQAVEAINNLSEKALVSRQTGGSQGGGTSLTSYGRRVVAAYRHLEKEWKDVPATIGRSMHDFDHYYRTIRRFDMQTSARNQFLGIVRTIKKGTINSEVLLDIGGVSELVATITNDSVDHLALEPGIETHALVKASWIILTNEDSVNTSAHNRLCGTVVRCQEGEIDAEVIIELAGGKTLAAVVTNDSIQSLGLKEGVRTCALIKPSHIILAIPF